MNTNKIAFDNRALSEKILEEYGTIKKFAATIQMKPRTLSSRLNDHTDFTIDEIEKIRRAFNMNKAEVDWYFFTCEGEGIENKKERQIYGMYLSLSEEKKRLVDTIVNQIIDNPAKLEFVKSWKGKMKDLPVALAQI